MTAHLTGGADKEALLSALKSALICLEYNGPSLLGHTCDTQEWANAAKDAYTAWQLMLTVQGVAAERGIGVHPEQPAVAESLRIFTDRHPWLRDSDQFEWVADRVAMLLPDSHEAWGMRGDAAQGIGMPSIAKEFYGRAAELCAAHGRRDGRMWGAGYRELVAECEGEFGGGLGAANEKLNAAMAGLMAQVNAS